MASSRSGAFMTDRPWQSQPTEAAYMNHLAVQIAIIRNP
jgi:hypothetical protein